MRHVDPALMRLGCDCQSVTNAGSSIVWKFGKEECKQLDIPLLLRYHGNMRVGLCKVYRTEELE